MKPAESARSWARDWTTATITVAILASAMDAILLQQGRSYFTGGFLSVYSVSTLSETLTFLLGSLLSDAAAAGAVVAGVLWAFGRFRCRSTVAVAMACALVLAPIVVADFAQYELARYLGDVFNLGLLLGLAGQNTGELLAVSSSHLMRIAWLGGAGGLVLVCVIGALVRFGAFSGGGTVSPVSLLRAIGVSGLACLVGVATTTVFRTNSELMDFGLRYKPTSQVFARAIARATDVDGDGFGLLAQPRDPNLFDSRIHSYALDIPGNGIDEDGVAGDLPAGNPYVERAVATGPWHQKPNVVLFLLEGVRADTLGRQVEGRPVTPVLNALAARGISSRRAYSHNGYTVQSRRHLFSGSTADIRGVETLLDDFKSQGYETAYFSGQDESFGGEGTGFERADVAYDARVDRNRRYSTFTTPGSLAVPASVVLERIDGYLAKRSAGRPLFLYVNFHDTHFPYHHRDIRSLLPAPVVDQPDIVPERAEAVRQMYLNTVANVDAAIGHVLEQTTRALGTEPAAIVVSDHGESLFEAGFLGHGYALNDAQTNIPLIAANIPLALEEPVGQSDLRDAIAAALAIPASQVSQPTLTASRSRVVFQYLGTLRNPAQIGFRSLEGGLAYDFRAERVRVDAGPWRPVRELSAGEQLLFEQLVHTWERMLLAKQAAGSDKAAN